MNHKNLPASLLFSTNAQKVLSYFLENPSEAVFDREVARKTGISRAGTNFALRDLAKTGLLHREKQGRMNFYSLNQSHALFHQLKILHTLTRLLPLLKAVQGSATRIILFGSAAKGENIEQSDIDLFILTRDKAAVEDNLYQLKLQIPLHLVLHTPQEWAKQERENMVFAEQVAHGIVLHQTNEPRI